MHLRTIRDFERAYLPFLKTIEDFDLIHEIGYWQERGDPTTLKQLFLAGIGTPPTVQRRLSRLRELGVVHQQRSDGDKRVVKLVLSPEVAEIFQDYALLALPE